MSAIDLAIGEVVELSTSDFESPSGMRVTHRLVAVGDESDPDAHQRLAAIGNAFEADLLLHPEWPSSLGASFDANPASRWLYLEDPAQTSMQEWARLFPTAKALYPLQRLDDGGRVLPGGTIDDRAKFLFTNMYDGIGLRARARIMADLLVGVAGSFEDQELSCVSLGCGAAVPDVEATLRIGEELGKTVRWQLYDVDADSLDFSRELAVEAGIVPGSIETFEASFVRAFRRESTGTVHAVDVLGLWEYLDDRTCVKLLQKSFKLLKPGGLFIASNMLSDRPQLQFNLRGVGWPLIKPRSDAELIAIVTEARTGGDLTLTRSEDGLYGVLEVRKPLA